MPAWDGAKNADCISTLNSTIRCAKNEPAPLSPVEVINPIKYFKYKAQLLISVKFSSYVSGELDPNSSDHVVAMTQLKETIASLQKKVQQKDMELLSKDKLVRNFALKVRTCIFIRITTIIIVGVIKQIQK